MVILGDDLRADHHVVAVRRHRVGEVGGGARPRQQIADHQARRGPRESVRRLPRSAARPRASAREPSIRRSGIRDRIFGVGGGIAAMVALQPADEPVLDQPGGAARTLQAMAAGPAQGQRGIAATVERRAAPAPQRASGFGHRRDQRRRQEAPRRQAASLRISISATDGRRAAACRSGRWTRVVTSARDVDHGFERRRRRDAASTIGTCASEARSTAMSRA